jgi:hypothetical protein
VLLAADKMSAKVMPMESPAPAPAARHPLLPPQADELEAAVAALRSELGSEAFFCHAQLAEPPKEATASHPRTIRIVGMDDALDGGFEADVAVGADSAVTLRRVPNTGQVTYGADIMVVMQLVFSDPGYHAALAKRGLAPDPSKIQIDPWPAGGFAPPDVIPAGHRSMRAIRCVCVCVCLCASIVRRRPSSPEPRLGFLWVSRLCAWMAVCAWAGACLPVNVCVCCMCVCVCDHAASSRRTTPTTGTPSPSTG